VTTLQNIRRYQTGGLALATGQTDEDPEVTVEEEEVVASPRAADRLAQILKRLQAQRVGPSESDKWWAISSALAKPTTSGGRFGQTLSNVGEAMTGYNAEKRKAEQEQGALVLRYELAQADLEGRADIAAQRANKPPSITPSDEARFRLGAARRLFPNKTIEQIQAENLMYSKAVNAETVYYNASKAATAAGEPYAPPPQAPPTLAEFLADARSTNPRSTDAELTEFWTNKYGKGGR